MKKMNEFLLHLVNQKIVSYSFFSKRFILHVSWSRNLMTLKNCDIKAVLCPTPSPKTFKKKGETCRPHPTKQVSIFNINLFFLKLFLLFLFLQVNWERHRDVGVPSLKFQTCNPTKSNQPRRGRAFGNQNIWG